MQTYKASVSSIYMSTERPPPWKDVLFFKNSVCNIEKSTYATYGEWIHEHTDDEAKLNMLRERIQDYEKEDDGKWEYYKKVINPYELIFTQRKYANFPDSVCILHPLSRSYFKMVEILIVSEFFKTFEKEDRIRTAHVCEGPGGFIEAILEECMTRHKTVSQSTAMTLRPNQANVPGWKRAATFLQKHRNVKVVYGADNTGDIIHVPNQIEFVEACGPKVHIFTSDGGFDFSTDYLSQERAVFPLLLASTRIGFEVLKDGGMFVLKFFDSYHRGTRDLIFFLSCFFKSWTMYKPATSRPCNPEQYFIGRGFKGCSVEILDRLKNWCSHLMLNFVQNSIYHGEIDADFEESMNQIHNKMVANQIHYLSGVFHNIEHSTDADIRAILKGHEYLSYMWCKTFNSPIYHARSLSIEASHSGQLGAARQQ